MNISSWVRQGHRWLAVAFTIGFVVNLLALAQQPVPQWVYVIVLIPLFLLFGSGIYLFMLPYLTRARRRSRAGE